MLLAASLSVLIGLALGLLGGGGSILTVPILIYALHMEPKTAIATSLLVVGVTSLVAVIPHARAGRVQWRTAWVFGGTGMIGAYAGGRVAAYLPSSLLLLGFAAMMLATAVAMIRGRQQRPVSAEAGGEACPTGMCAPVRSALHGLIVGAVTGLIGAGGGFLVVPALALLGGLSMPVAVGTSLLVIAIKSLAGFARSPRACASPLGHRAGGHQRRHRRCARGQSTGQPGAGGRASPDLRLGCAGDGGVPGGPAVAGRGARRWPPTRRCSSSAGRSTWPGRRWVRSCCSCSGSTTSCWASPPAVPSCLKLHCDPAARRSWRVPFIGGILLGGVVAGLLRRWSPDVRARSLRCPVLELPRWSRSRFCSGPGSSLASAAAPRAAAPPATASSASRRGARQACWPRPPSWSPDSSPLSSSSSWPREGQHEQSFHRLRSRVRVPAQSRGCDRLRRDLRDVRAHGSTSDGRDRSGHRRRGTRIRSVPPVPREGARGRAAGARQEALHAGRGLGRPAVRGGLGDRRHLPGDGARPDRRRAAGGGRHVRRHRARGLCAESARAARARARIAPGAASEARAA